MFGITAAKDYFPTLLCSRTGLSSSTKKKNWQTHTGM